MGFYEKVYPLLFAALQIAKQHGHTIKKAERLKDDPPNRINTGFKWWAVCEKCETEVWAALDEEAQIFVGGIPILMTCEQAQRHVKKFGQLRIRDQVISGKRSK